jgi:outer membrane protein OmpA-like peptidoglycan-associated protein
VEGSARRTIPRRTGNRWVWPVLALAAYALGAVFLSRGSGREVAMSVQNTPVIVKLPDASEVDLLPNSFNYNLATFLKKGSASELPKTFVFGNLNFVSGSTGLTPEPVPTVTALAAILKAYPNADIELSG